jgi:hypothetical protein
MRSSLVGTGARAKLDRAKFHLEELRRKVYSGEYNAGQIGALRQLVWIRLRILSIKLRSFR